MTSLLIEKSKDQAPKYSPFKTTSLEKKVIGKLKFEGRDSQMEFLMFSSEELKII